MVSTQDGALHRISFMGANYVARCVGYHMTNWGEGQDASNAYYQPIDTFAGRFSELLEGIRAMGFTTLDLWTGQLNWSWATTEHLQIAAQLLKENNLRVASLAGYFGATRAELESSCRLATAVGTAILGGNTDLVYSDRPSTVAILKEHGIRLGIENHPAEKTAADMLAKVGDAGDGTIGTVIDTGWYATHGYDGVTAIKELYPHIIYVHLKDILAPGAHDTCRFGQGCVDIPGCVATLQDLGYSGTYSIEHEPHQFDPTEDCTVMFAQLRTWLA